MVELLSPILILGLIVVTIKILGTGIGMIASMGNEIGARMQRIADRKQIRYLLNLPRATSWQRWQMSAPESWALFNGIEDSQASGFKMGLLQLLAARNLTMEVFFGEQSQGQNGNNIRETILVRGPVSPEGLSGSLAAIYHLWESLSEPRTIRSLAQQVRQKYGSLAGFTDAEVKLGLMSAGLYERKEYRYPAGNYAASYYAARSAYTMNTSESELVIRYLLTSSGQTAKRELESRLSEVLNQFDQERKDWVRKKPHQALIAAIVSIAVGQTRLVEEAEMQLITQSTNQVRPIATIEPEMENSYEPSLVWIDWNTFDNLDRAFAAVETECDAVVQDGDGSGGDGGDSGGDSGDYGDSGGGGGD